jgi:hypothetical protein
MLNLTFPLKYEIQSYQENILIDQLKSERLKGEASDAELMFNKMMAYHRSNAGHILAETDVSNFE